MINKIMRSIRSVRGIFLSLFFEEISNFQNSQIGAKIIPKYTFEIAKKQVL